MANCAVFDSKNSSLLNSKIFGLSKQSGAQNSRQKVTPMDTGSYSQFVPKKNSDREAVSREANSKKRK